VLNLLVLWPPLLLSGAALSGPEGAQQKRKKSTLVFLHLRSKKKKKYDAIDENKLYYMLSKIFLLPALHRLLVFGPVAEEERQGTNPPCGTIFCQARICIVMSILAGVTASHLFIQDSWVAM
jgi:hypothetical protein